MLEPLARAGTAGSIVHPAMTSPRGATGFTLTEVVLVVALLAILLALAAPSIQAMLDRNSVRSAASNLGVDVQYARSEAVRTNAPVAFVLSPASTPWCYGITTTSTCTCSTAGSCNLKTVTGDDYRNLALALVDADGYTGANGFSIDPRQGGVSTIPGSGHGPVTTITLRSTTTPGAEVASRLNALGHLTQCSPDGSLSGYPACSP